MQSAILTSCPTPQYTQNICITFVQSWANVEDVGPALYKCYTNVLCLLSSLSMLVGIGYDLIIPKFKCLICSRNLHQLFILD